MNLIIIPVREISPIWNLLPGVNELLKWYIAAVYSPHHNALQRKILVIGLDSKNLQHQLNHQFAFHAVSYRDI